MSNAINPLPYTSRPPIQRIEADPKMLQEVMNVVEYVRNNSGIQHALRVLENNNQRIILSRMQEDALKKVYTHVRNGAGRIEPGIILEAQSLHGALDLASIKELKPRGVVASITGAALELARITCTNKQKSAIRKGEHPVSKLSLPGKDFANHLSIAANQFRNLLRFLGLLDQISYSWIQDKNLYLHGAANCPTDFARYLISHCIEIISCKKVLEIGAGRGNDSAAFAQDASSVEMIESSQKMVRSLKKKQRLATTPNSFHAPEKAEDMFVALRRMKQDIIEGRREPLDFIYSHSSAHFYNDDEFMELIDLCRDCLVDGGHLAIAMKAPNSLFDGPGTHLIHDDVEANLSPLNGNPTNTHYPLLHFDLCPDGITRAFRCDMTIEEMVKSLGFDRIHRSTSQITNYEVPGSTQDMYHFIFKKTSGLSK